MHVVKLYRSRDDVIASMCAVSVCILKRINGVLMCPYCKRDIWGRVWVDEGDD